MNDLLQTSHLGKLVVYADQYDPNLLFQMPRSVKRLELGIEQDSCPFYGEDLWTAYEVSWLMPGGKPQVAIMEFIIPADSFYLIESKSIKLYLNSFNQTIFPDALAVEKIIAADLSKMAQAEVAVRLFHLQDYLNARPLVAFAGESFDF